jgi:hypothetical protein
MLYHAQPEATHFSIALGYLTSYEKAGYFSVAVALCDSPDAPLKVGVNLPGKQSTLGLSVEVDSLIEERVSVYQSHVPIPIVTCSSLVDFALECALSSYRNGIRELGRHLKAT